MSFIEVRDLKYTYNLGEEDAHEAIKGLSMDIEEGQFVALLGHNGCGKSTLAKIFNGMYTPLSGSVKVDGLDTSIEKNQIEVRRKVGLVQQNPDNQLVAGIVEEDVAFGPENLGVPPLEIRERVDEALKAVNMYEYREHAPFKLSGGQKQRVAIAGVIAMRTKCIVLDEPTAMLDPSGRLEVIRTIHELNRQEGLTVILITHYMEETVNADRIIVMDDGEVKMEGTPREIFTCVKELKSMGLDVPQVTELAWELSESGLAIDKGILTVEELVEALCRLN